MKDPNKIRKPDRATEIIIHSRNEIWTRLCPLGLEAALSPDLGIFQGC